MDNQKTPNAAINYIHEQRFHIPAERMQRALGDAALPNILIQAGDVPGIISNPVKQPGEVASVGAQHDPVPLGAIDEFLGNPERAINHPANIAKADRDFVAVTGIAVRRDHGEE